VRQSSGIQRLAKFIKEESERYNLSQRDLASEDSVSQGTISRLFSGQTKPELETIEALGEQLGYSLESMLLIMIDSPDADTSRFLDIWKRLDAKSHELLIRFAQAMIEKQDSVTPRSQ